MLGARPLTERGNTIPPWFKDISVFQTISTTAYDPIATYQASAMASIDLSTLHSLVDGGFGVKNATENAGYIYAITLDQLQRYRSLHKGTTEASWDVSAIVPRKIQLYGGEWAMTPIVKVFAGNHATYASTVTDINIGKIS